MNAPGDTAPSIEPWLTVEGLGHRFTRGRSARGRRVLEGLTFGVRRGEVFGLLGPNGSGKSTALGVLAGTLELQEGAIALEGRAVHRQPRWFRERLGVVFQSPSLDPLLTARENLVLAAGIQGFDRRQARLRAALGLERAGLVDRGADAVGTFSGGMKRRLDLARALIHEPDLLLMDEPTAGLDEASFRRSWDTLERLREERQITVLLATHRPDEAERCDRLAIIQGGRAERIDSPDRLKAEAEDDVLILEGPDLGELRREVAERLGLEGVIVAAGGPAGGGRGQLRIECERGHELIPRLVEQLTAARLSAVSLRHPTLADVFVKLTGHRLDEDEVAELLGSEAGAEGRSREAA